MAKTNTAVDVVIDKMTPPQKAKIEGIALRSRDRAQGPRMKLALSETALTICYDGDGGEVAALLALADLGTCDMAFYSGVTGQIANIGSHKQKVDETNSNFLLSVVRAVQPRDELETLLAVQMGAIHAATMMMARRLNHVDNIPQQDAAERALNKLARTYAGQMETLKRYRTGGQQKVIVEHVTVQSGGQAIVGVVTQGGVGAS